MNLQLTKKSPLPSTLIGPPSYLSCSTTRPGLYIFKGLRPQSFAGLDLEGGYGKTRVYSNALMYETGSFDASLDNRQCWF